MSLALSEAIAQLADASSPRRRAAAKRLRALADPSAGPALVGALRAEVSGPGTWETQYQLVMALAMSDYRSAFPFLQGLAVTTIKATAVYTALGDAIVRLGRDHDQDPAPVDWCLATGNDMLADGALRAVAMLRLTLDDPAVERIISFVSRRDPYDGLRFWPAAAAAGWSGPRVTAFLTDCVALPRQDVSQAAQASLEGRYKAYKPF